MPCPKVGRHTSNRPLDRHNRETILRQQVLNALLSLDVTLSFRSYQ